MKYKPKHIKTVDAVRWDATDEALDLIDDLGASASFDYSNGLKLLAGVDGAQGFVDVPVGHWIIKGAPNDFWPVDPNYFTENYEPC